MRELYERLSPRLAGLSAYYARRCREDADDLLQEAWLGVFEALPRLDVTIGDPEQYLLRYARWRVLDVVRRSLRREAPTALEEDLSGPGGVGEVLDSLLLARFLAQLTPIQRDVIACLLAGCTWREAGVLLGCSSANVAYHVRRIGERYRAWRQQYAAAL